MMPELAMLAAVWIISLAAPNAETGMEITK